MMPVAEPAAVYVMLPLATRVTPVPALPAFTCATVGAIVPADWTT